MNLTIYTDGATSKNGNEHAHGGWAYLILDENEHELFRGSGHVNNTTNNQCELLAVIAACSFAYTKWKDIDSVTIYTDSAYISNCFRDKWYKKWQQNGWLNSKKEPVANQHLWELLLTFFTKPNFTIEKVKGHSTNKFNNIVDELAVTARIIGENI